MENDAMHRTRDTLKRQYGQAYTYIEQALIVLGDLNKKFSEQHPEYCPLFESVGMSLLMAESGIEDIVRLTFGYVPANFSDWRQ